MASKDLVLAQPLFGSSNASSKKRRSRGRKRQPRGTAPPRSEAAAFSDLEQAFFAAAPSDEPAAVELESFDDLATSAAVAPDLFGAWRQALVAVAVVLASLPARLRAQRSAPR
jgi:hypothetical protein